MSSGDDDARLRTLALAFLEGMRGEETIDVDRFLVQHASDSKRLREGLRELASLREAERLAGVERLFPSPDTEFEPTLALDEATEIAEMFDDRYRVIRELGKGGFGRVLLVEDKLHGGERLALKSILPERQNDTQFEDRFRNEIRVLRNLRHESIPQIFNDGKTAAGELYYTMAFVEGRELSDVIKADGPIEPRRAARIALEIASVLADAHEHGVVHRDLKPGNVMLVRAGEPDETIHVLDFGIAKIMAKEGGLQHALTMQTQAPIGTPHYMAPEQVSGAPVDGRTDVYALGVLMHHMLSGKYPFGGKTWMELLAARLKDEPTPLDARDAPVWSRRLVRDMLQRDPEQRPDAAELERRLRAVLADDTQVSAPARAMQGRRGLAAALVVALAVGGGLYLWRPWREAAPPPTREEDDTLTENAEQELPDGAQPTPADTTPAPVLRSASFATPLEGARFATGQVVVSGTVEPVPARIAVGSTELNLDVDSAFETSLSLPEGNHTIEVRDLEQERVLATRTVLVDLTDPELELEELPGVALPDGARLVAERRVRMSGRVTDDGGLARVECQGEPYALEPGGELDVTVSLGDGPDGRYPVTLRAVDRVDRSTEMGWTFVVDRTKPKIIEEPGDDRLAFRVVDEHVGPVYVDGGVVNLDDEGGYALEVALEPGATRTFRVMARDLAKNETERSIVVSGPEPPAAPTPVVSETADPAPASEIVVPRLPPGVDAIGSELSADGLPLRIEHLSTGIELVLVPAGEVEAPEGRIRIARPFYMALGETSWGAYLTFTEATGRPALRRPRFKPADDHPVSKLTVEEARAFCQWAGVRLPTRDEWTWAARGADAREFPWEGGWDATRCNSAESDAFPETAPVEGLPDGASWCGVRNLCGNVSEWVTAGEDHQVFGGSFRDKRSKCTPTPRVGFSVPQAEYIGFRIALDPP